MGRRIALSALAAGAVLAGGLAASGTFTAPSALAAAPCIVVRPEVRYVPYGYWHIVHLENTCEDAHLCKVATNVNRAPQEVVVPASASVEVVTFRGSPSRVFTPIVTCSPL